MKRSTLVEKLIKEGMSEKTLVKFTDKQLFELSERMLGEQMKQLRDKMDQLTEAKKAKKAKAAKPAA